MRLVEEGHTFAQLLLETHGQDYAVGMRLASLVRSGVLRTEEAKGFRGASVPQVENLDPDREFEQTFESLFDELEPAPPKRSTNPFAPVPKEEPPPWAKAFANALVLLRQNRGEDARRELLVVLELDPRNALARASLEKAQRMMVEQARQSGLADDRILTLRVPLASLVGRPMSPNEAFVLSRLAAGKMSVGQLLQVCPLPDWEVLPVLQHSVADGVIG
jgi:hypothetical protein